MPHHTIIRLTVMLITSLFVNSCFESNQSSGINLDKFKTISSTSLFVSYSGNGNTSGQPPSDTNKYGIGDIITILDNTGNMTKTQDGISFIFVGWNTKKNGTGLDYKFGDTFPLGNSSISLHAKWTSIKAIGPAGGIIFYDKGRYSDNPSWRYMEVAPVEPTLPINTIRWGTRLGIPGGTGTAIGSGRINTLHMLKWLNKNNYVGLSNYTYAALWSKNLAYGGKNDWFIPSKDEIQAIWWNLVSDHSSDNNGRGKPYEGSVGNFQPKRYWSSSGDYQGWLLNFTDGMQSTEDAFIPLTNIRAVRAF